MTTSNKSIHWYVKLKAEMKSSQLLCSVLPLSCVQQLRSPTLPFRIHLFRGSMLCNVAFCRAAVTLQWCEEKGDCLVASMLWGTSRVPCSLEWHWSITPTADLVKVHQISVPFAVINVYFMSRHNTVWHFINTHWAPWCLWVTETLLCKSYLFLSVL